MAFIVFEGGEATGKSTQIKLLSDWLKSCGISCLVTREPGGAPFAEDIRALFKGNPRHDDHPTAVTELLLVMAARAQHVERTIRPALARGTWVLCDRFLDSSYVYQGIRGGVANDYINAVAAGVLQGVVPELTLVFDAPVEVARARMGGRDVESDRLDRMDEALHTRINDGFVLLAEKRHAWPCGVVPCREVVDASRAMEEVAASVQELVRRHVGVPR